MKRKDMARILPFETDYSLLDKCRLAETIGLYTVSAMSIIVPLLSLVGTGGMWSVVSTVINLINLIITERCKLL